MLSSQLLSRVFSYVFVVDGGGLQYTAVYHPNPNLSCTLILTVLYLMKKDMIWYNFLVCFLQSQAIRYCP